MSMLFRYKIRIAAQARDGLISEQAWCVAARSMEAALKKAKFSKGGRAWRVQSITFLGPDEKLPPVSTFDL